MGVRRTLKKRRTARKRQNGGVFTGAPVNHSISFGQRQPTEAIMNWATTVGGGKKRKGSYRKRMRRTRRN